ncbi:hypothetical protein [Jiella sp. M17.18]|uniref:hypothetical protein n=1 Tax=Jiella sp. M17.18 TaxID=3234247 RepID=UPI0034DEDD33
MTSAPKLHAICLTTAAVLAGGMNIASAYGKTHWQRTDPQAVTLQQGAPVQLAAEDCSSAADRAASQTGGQVLSVSMRRQGGQTVCVVTVLVPARDGERPRKKTVTIKP